MESSPWLLFASAVLAASISPGPNVLIVVLHSIRYGLRSAPYTIAGNLTAILIFALISALGIGALLKAFPTFLFFFKLIGAAYLIYMGVRILRSSINGFGVEAIEEKTSDRIENLPKLKLYKESFICSSSNPKSILFLSAIFPQFLDVQQSIAPQFAIMFATILFIVGTVHSSYAFVADKSLLLFSSSKVKRRFSIFSGMSFIGFGIILAPFKKAWVSS